MPKSEPRAQRIVGLDPATGISSRTGFAVIDPYQRKLVMTASIGSELDKTRPLHEHVKALFNQVLAYLNRLNQQYDLYVGIEHFVMQGRAGQMLNQVVGGFIAACPDSAIVDTLHTMTVKKTVFGSVPKGLTKLQIAEASKNFFKDKASKQKIQELIEEKAWDITDAIAIAITMSSKTLGIGM